MVNVIFFRYISVNFYNINMSLECLLFLSLSCFDKNNIWPLLSGPVENTNSEMLHIFILHFYIIIIFSLNRKK